MTNFGVIKREVLLFSLLCVTVTLIEAVNRNELRKMNRKIDRMIGGLQGQLITAMLEIEDLRNSTAACKCEHQTTTEHVDSQQGITNSNEKTESDTQTITTLVEIIFNGFMDEKYARKQLELQMETRIKETIKSQNNEYNRLQKVVTDINKTNAVQHTEIQRLDALNEDVNIKSEKLMADLEEISNSSKSDRDEINRLIELMLDMNNTVITQHDEIERLNKELSMFKTNAKPKYEEIDSLIKTLRVMTNTIDWMTTSIPICTKPELINNGNVEYSGTVMGSVVTYTCNEGYSLQGVNERKCLQKKQWEETIPVCTPDTCFLHVNNDSKYWFKIDDSVDLITENKYIDHGIDVFIECKDGYILTNAQDETAATRQTTHCYFGTWKNAYNCRPGCVVDDQNRYSFYNTFGLERIKLENGAVVGLGTKVYVQCLTNDYIDLYDINEEWHVTCTGNTFTKIPDGLECTQVVECEYTVIHGELTIAPGGIGNKLNCNKGYTSNLQDSDTVSCEDGKLKSEYGLDPACNPEYCAPPKTNARITNPRKWFGPYDNPELQCPDNLVLSTTEKLECKDGTWSLKVYCVNQYTNTNYTLLVYTGNDWSAGTRSSVNINIIGRKDSTGELRLGDGFEGGTLYPKLLYGIDVGEITNIKLSLIDSGLWRPIWRHGWIAIFDQVKGYCSQSLGFFVKTTTVYMPKSYCCNFHEARKIDYPRTYYPRNPTLNVDDIQCKLLCAQREYCQGVLHHVTRRACYLMRQMYNNHVTDKSHMGKWFLHFYKKTLTLT